MKKTISLALSCLVLLAAGLTAAPVAGAADRGAVLVAGATGRTGQPMLGYLADAGFTPIAMVRDEASAREKLGDDVEMRVADVRDRASLDAAMDGVVAIISTVGAGREADNLPEFVDYGGVKNMAEAATDAGLKQMVLVSSGGVTQEDHPLNKMFNDVLKWKLKGEDALRASGTPYTVIRPTGLINKPGGENAVTFVEGDQATGTVTREDVAMACVQALLTPDAQNKTFGMTGTEAPGPSDWAALFSSIPAD